MVRSKSLTEYGAWLYIAKRFKIFHDTGEYEKDYIGTRGLCAAINRLMDNSRITFSVWSEMYDKIYKYRIDNDSPVYIWPVDRTHALNRSKLATQFAKQV